MSCIICRIDGCSIQAPLGDHITRCLQSGSWYESGLLEAIRAMGISGGYVDVGAHVGNHSVYFARHCSPDWIMAIEPSIRWQMLRDNLAANANGVPAVALQVAIHDRWKTCSIVEGPPGNTGMASISEGGPVPCSPLSALLKSRRVGLLKVDAEGADAAVVRSGLAMIERDHPVIVAEAAAPDLLADLYDLLSPLGYSHGVPFNATPTYIWTV